MFIFFIQLLLFIENIFAQESLNSLGSPSVLSGGYFPLFCPSIELASRLFIVRFSRSPSSLSSFCLCFPPSSSSLFSVSFVCLKHVTFLCAKVCLCGRACVSAMRVYVWIHVIATDRCWVLFLRSCLSVLYPNKATGWGKGLFTVAHNSGDSPP